MAAPHRIVSLHGLAFGDCGKGLATDHLTRRLGAHTVVRFNGGAQAGHNVVLEDGRQHTFSQFGAGSFVAGVVTVLASPVVVHPAALLHEERVLRSKGVHDALARLRIDGRCKLTTPLHQAAGRLREWRRGATRHGSCGAGVGETVRHALQWPEQALRYADLEAPQRALQKFEAIRESLAGEFADLHADDLSTKCGAATFLDPLGRRPASPGLGALDSDRGAAARAEARAGKPSALCDSRLGERAATAASQAVAAAELAALRDPTLGRRWLEQALVLLRAVAPHSEPLTDRLGLAGTTIFEGAQGVLLDEWRGFHPHTTWSSTGTDAVQALLADAGFGASRALHYGVLRSYLTRHGEGPLPTEDASLDAIGEPHNADGGWQGTFRRGHADGVLLAYSSEVVGRLDGLILTHLDALHGPATLRWCRAYRGAHAADAEAALIRDGAGEIVRLRPGRIGDLDHQCAMTGALSSVTPVFEGAAVADADALVERVEAATGCRVVATAHGPTWRQVRERGSLAAGA